MEKVNSTLYNLNKAGKTKVWEVYIEESKVIVKYGLEGGKIQEKVTEAKPKNIGKANETSAQEQAFKEAISKWNKQKDRKGYVEDKAQLSSTNNLNCRPMLAIEGNKNKKAIKFPCDYSYKMDGLRTIITLSKDNIVSYSRGLLPYNIPNELKEELETLSKVLKGIDYLDGELYIHKYYLQDINSIVKNSSHPDRSKLELVLFDIPSSNKIWEDRLKDLNNLKEKLVGLNQIKIIEYKTANSFEELEIALEEAINQGYEGLVIRNKNGLYEFNHRSRNMIKLKKMQSSEALILSTIEDKNGEGILKCQWTNPNNKQVEFECKLKGDHKSRSFEACQTLIGKWITFTYQDLTKAGKPSIPVGINIRLMDELTKTPLE